MTKERVKTMPRGPDGSFARASFSSSSSSSLASSAKATNSGAPMSLRDCQQLEKDANDDVKHWEDFIASPHHGPGKPDATIQSIYDRALDQRARARIAVIDARQRSESDNAAKVKTTFGGMRRPAPPSKRPSSSSASGNKSLYDTLAAKAASLAKPPPSAVSSSSSSAFLPLPRKRDTPALFSGLPGAGGYQDDDDNRLAEAAMSPGRKRRIESVKRMKEASKRRGWGLN